jgi:hypothetical protein
MKTLLLLLLVLLGVALGVQRTVGTKTGIPEAGHAVMQEVLAERRKAAMASQETNQGYVIDPALAGRMLADTGIAIHGVAVRGLGPERIARAELQLPGADGPKRVTKYVKVTQVSPSEWKAVGPATRLMWETKLW